MASRTVSPGAALLRTSRLFSLPAPLPPAPSDMSDSSKRTSNTATTPFPTMQAITTPRAARKRGDWGVKRALPSKAANATSQPSVRIRELDSFENVTDYASATDHAVTLRKWQALGIPITAQTDAEQRQHLAGRSVFEESADITAIDAASRHTAKDKRWKFAGPWLAGLTEGAFQTYLSKQVRTRRSEFHEFLREQLAVDRNAAAAAAAASATPEGAAESPTSAPDAAAAGTIAAADIGEAELTDYLRILRHDRPLLFRLVGKFLDLAPVEPSERFFQNLARSTLGGGAGSDFLSPLTSGRIASSPTSLSAAAAAASSSSAATGNPWTQDGPPITHPSAGLSYLRSNAYLDNHPLYGPQKSHAPVDARVVMPRASVGSWSAKLGVAGFVTENPYGDTAYANTRQSTVFGQRGSAANKAHHPALNSIDPALHGGAKMPVRVAAAKINAQGRVVLSVAEADPEAVLVQRELEGRETLHGEPSRLQSTRAESQPRRLPLGLGRTASAATSPVFGSPKNYGLGQ